MNRIEKILEELEKKLADCPEDQYYNLKKMWIELYGKQVGFFRWLLEEAEDTPTYEIHQEKINPSAFT